VHIEADLLDDVGNIGAGKRQVLHGPDEAL
jgi:hypothetical protein